MPAANVLPDNVLERLEAEGFLLLKLPDEHCEAIAATFDAGYPFFRAPLDEKMASRFPEDFGYRPLGIEYSQSPDRPDPVESFTVSIRRRAALTALRSAKAQVLRDRMLASVEALELLVERLTILIADTLGGKLSGDKLQGALSHWSCLQLNYSRPAEVDTHFIHETHEDGHLLTVTCATASGLEVQTSEGEFTPVSIGRDEVLIMPGEVIWLLSGGRIRPLYHRVRREPHHSERMALQFFADINPRLCEPWIHNEINKDIDVGGRVLMNATRFGLDGFTLD